MESLVWLVAIIAILWVVYWALQNENAPDIEGQKGLFRMMPPKLKPGEKTAMDDEAADRKSSS